jgi:hypothetical protein
VSLVDALRSQTRPPGHSVLAAEAASCGTARLVRIHARAEVVFGLHLDEESQLFVQLALEASA